jgi:hypothetical protein
LAVLFLLTLQYLLGATAYLWPKLSLNRRRALAPLHAYLGKAVFVGGLATMAAGIQEKQTFIQTLAKPSSVFAGVMRLPVLIQVLLLLTGIAILYHHVPPARQQEPEHETLSLADAAEPALSEDGRLGYADDHRS